MEKVKVPSSGTGYLELGITQDPSEVTNSANSYRVVTLKKDDEIEAVGIERVVDGVWTPVKIDTFLALVNTILRTNKKLFDIPKLEEENSFYVLVLDSVQGNPFEGLKSPMDDIDKIINAPNRKITEEDFVSNYAVFFLRNYDEMVKVDPEYPEKYNAAMRRWSVDVAHHSQAVDVVQRTSGGIQHLFTLPPRVLSNDIFDNGKTEESIEEVIYEVAFLGQTDPGGAERYLENGLSKKLIQVPDDVVRKQSLDAMIVMDDIRERYGIPRFLTKKPEVTKNESAAKDDDDEGFKDDEMGQF